LIVSDSSPLIVLKKAGAIQLLQRLFSRVLIPEAVWAEVCIKEREFFERLEFLSIETPRRPELVGVLEILVDTGEAEAIALSLERSLAILIDDLRGRRVARRLGLVVVGSLGVLALAKKRGLIPEVRPYVSRLRSSGCYLSDELVETFLRRLGEAEGSR